MSPTSPPAPDPQPPQTQLRSVQIVVAALAMGCVSLAIVAAVLVSGGSRPTQPGLISVMAPAWGVLGMSELTAWMFLRGALLKRARTIWESGPRDADAAGSLVNQFSIYHILRAAMVEGWSLFAAVIFLLTGVWPMLVGAGAGVIILIVNFPTRRGLEWFLERASSGQIRSAAS